MRVMGIGAHPDDLELMAGGTLARCVRRGDAVTMVYVTNGDMGHAVLSPSELAGIRKEEAHEACEVIGAQFEWLGFPDEWLFSESEQARRAVVNVIRKHQPDLILTHPANDYHPDHRAAFHLVFAASFLATIPHIRSEFPPLAKVPEVFLMDVLGGVDSNPSLWVDITDVMETKRRALECHQSQLQWMKDHDHIDFVDWMRIVSEYRGLQAGVRYAEGFRQERRWPALSARRLLP